MIRMFILLLMFLFTQFVSGQEVMSRTTEFMDSLNALNDPINWGEGMEYIYNVERLAEIAMLEGRYKIYEQCRTSIHYKYYEMDDFVGLDNAINKSLKFAQDTVNSSLDYRTGMLNDKVTMLKHSGRLKDVIDKRWDVIELLKNELKLRGQLGKIYRHLVVDYNILGDFEQSRKYSEYGLTLLQDELEENYGKAFFYNNIGRLDQKIMNYDLAIENLLKAQSFLSMVKEEGLKTRKLVIDNLLMTCETYIYMGEFSKAKMKLKEAEKLQKTLDYRVFRTLEVKAIYNIERGDFEDAIRNIENALKLVKDKPISRGRYLFIPRLYYRLAELGNEIDNLEMSINSIQKGLCYFGDSLNLNAAYNPVIASELANDISLKLISLKSKIIKNQFFKNSTNSNYLLAKSTFITNLNLLSFMRKSYLNNESKFYVLEKALPVYNSYLDLVYNHIEETGDKSDKELLYNIIGQTKSAILSDNFNYKNVINDPKLSPSLVDEEKDLRLKRALYKKQVKKMELQDSIDMEKLASMKDSLFSFNQDYDILDKRIRETKEEVAGWNLNDDISFNKFSEQLRSGEMVIDYYESDEYIYSVAILDGEIFVERICLSDIEEEVNSFVNYISTPPSTATSINVEEVSQKILNTLLKRYLENKSSVNSLRILPSGILNSMPFEALSYEEQGTTKYLIEDCPILYSVSRSQLLQRGQIPSSYNIMALAPKFESEVISDTRYACDGAELSNLKYAQEEVGYIHDAYQISSNDSISANYFLNNISNHDICHLATHGCVNTSDPMLSEIFFNDQPVTGYDVMNLDTDVSLMFLSACNTAKGEDVQGEGVVGITSGFFEAGVRNMVSSLWSIDDLASSQIVKGFYKNVKEGSTYSESLRSSKLEYLESADKLRSHPYYWAGLVQIGAGVTVSNSLPWGIYLGGLGFLGFGYLFWKNKADSSLNT